MSVHGYGRTLSYLSIMTHLQNVLNINHWEFPKMIKYIHRRQKYKIRYTYDYVFFIFQRRCHAPSAMANRLSSDNFLSPSPQPPASKKRRSKGTFFKELWYIIFLNPEKSYMRNMICLLFINITLKKNVQIFFMLF